MRYIFKFHLRLFFLFSFFLFLLTNCTSKKDQAKTTDKLTDDEIGVLIKKNSPLNGAKIPDDIKFRLGAAHVAGKYYLTDEPFMIEGCKAIQHLGLGIVKLWLQGDPEGEYPYNSKWNLADHSTSLDIVSHPYFKTVFDMPFKVFVLSVSSKTNLQKAWEQPTTDYSEEENSMYKLAKYLLVTYRNRDIVFILQNWEGDWLLRDGTGPDAQWTPDLYPTNITKRCNVMINWFKARQAGIEHARNEVGKTKCNIYHAIEVNKVLDCKKGVPGLTSDVLPYVKTDLVSWSCYDGMANPVDLWRGIEYIKENMKPTGVFPGTPVMIGEIGIPENEGTVFGIPAQAGKIVKDELIKRWDNAISVFLAQDIPYVIQWEVYCNEPKSDVKDTLVHTTDEMRGFWLIRPDGTESYSASYLKRLVQNAGKKIKNNIHIK